MTTNDVRHLEITEGPLRVGFPVAGEAASAAVYFELDPGAAVGSHTDSAEEIIVVLEGTAEATVGDERALLRAGRLAVVPANVPHDVRNVGDGGLRVLGFFAAGTIVSTFADPPFGEGPSMFVNGRPVAELDTTLAV